MLYGVSQVPPRITKDPSIEPRQPIADPTDLEGWPRRVGAADRQHIEYFFFSQTSAKVSLLDSRTPSVYWQSGPRKLPNICIRRLPHATQEEGYLTTVIPTQMHKPGGVLCGC